MAKVLIVEDEVSLVEMYKTILQKNGFETIECFNGREGLRALDIHAFDLVVSDIKMPIMDGIELLGEIRKRDPKHPPVLLVSGYSEYSQQDMIEKGAIGFLQKPIRTKALIERIHEILAAPA